MSVLLDETSSDIRIQQVTGKHQVRLPVLECLLLETNPGDFASHAEANLGTQLSNTRIQKLKNKGWVTGAVVEFNLLVE